MRLKCHCDCGNYKWINAYNVVNGRSKSCGCGEKLSRHTREHKKDISGSRFGKLLVIRDSGKRDVNSSVIWECLCDCGNIIELSASSLTRGRATSCGCEKVHANTVDITGQVFGMLTVLGIDRSRQRKKGDKLHWKCRCECGNETSVDTNSLTSGNTVSCGCTQMSYHEKYISSILDRNGLKYEKQKRFTSCKNIRTLPFDFYLPDLNTVIEYDGRQHYEPVSIFGGEDGLARRRYLDNIKSKYCKENNIHLIRLPYTMSYEEIKQTVNTLRTRNE